MVVCVYFAAVCARLHKQHCVRVEKSCDCDPRAQTHARQEQVMGKAVKSSWVHAAVCAEAMHDPTCTFNIHQHPRPHNRNLTVAAATFGHFNQRCHLPVQ